MRLTTKQSNEIGLTVHHHQHLPPHELLSQFSFLAAFSGKKSAGLQAKNQKTTRQNMLCASVSLPQASQDVARNETIESRHMLTLARA